MENEIKQYRSDDMLAPFLDTKSQSMSDELLSAIINEHADPIITRILKSKLRVSLNERGTQQNPRFDLWQAEDKRWYASFSRRPETGSDGKAPDVSDSFLYRTVEALSDAMIKPDEFLAVLFERAGGPIDFDEVVNIAAETWQIHDRPTESIDACCADRDSSFTSPEPRLDLAL